MPRRLVTSALAALTLGLAAVSFAAPGAAPPSAPAKVDRENTLYLDLKDGRVVIKLLPELAPKMVERVKVLARQKFYDGTPFHRVIGGFMAQGGDPTGSGQGGSKLPDLPAEFTTKAQFVRGALGAARTQDPNSANSQFFIMFAPAPNLDGQYTLWGQVTSGMELVDKIKRGDGPNGQVAQPDRIVQLRVAADVKE
jgi:peptidylprolyl isomerase